MIECGGRSVFGFYMQQRKKNSGWKKVKRM